MPAWCNTGALYKGLLFLVLILLVLEYRFGSLSESGYFLVFNETRTIPPDRRPQQSPLITSLRFRNNSHSSPSSGNHTTNTTSSASTIFRNQSTPDMLSVHNNNITMEHLTSTLTSNSSVLPPCPDISTNLRGRVPIIKSPVPSITQLEHRFSWLQPGGHYQPPDCQTSKKIALVIPFRCRGEHLLLFLQHMHPFLKKQQLDYTIFIVEQSGEGAFNRAMLMNVGFTEALKSEDFDCFIFHDIDLLPEDERNLYDCPPGQPRHMSVAVDILKYRLPYPAIFGGVSAINTDQFKQLNGFSNSFWGWGGEDDDMSNRIKYHNLFISRYPVTIARYTMLTHKKEKPSPNRYDVLKQGAKRYDKDGLNSLRYKMVESKKNLLYTWFLVNLERPS